MNNKTNFEERAKAVLAMEYLARQINDEEVFEPWLSIGVADGDIDYGCLEINDDNVDDLGYYCDDENFRDLMTAFLKCMKNAWKSGGLYCNYVTSKDASDYKTK